MPCNSSHMEPRGFEVEISKVAALIDELDGHTLVKHHYDGYHPCVYGKNIDRDTADKYVSELCSKCRQVDVREYSLELQIWWRDHQEEDKKKSYSIDGFIVFATKAHAGQTRKGSGLPYIVHPIAVMNQLLDWGIKDVEHWAIAIGHDILEDCPQITEKMLIDVSSEYVTSVIKELTFTPTADGNKKEEKANYLNGWLEKNKSGKYKKSTTSLVVKIADRVCNTLDFMIDSPGYALKYYNKAEILKQAFLERSDDVIDQYGEETVRSIDHTLNMVEETLEARAFEE